MKNIFFLLSVVFFNCGYTPSTNNLIRQFSSPVKDNVINLKYYGAKGLGVSSIKEDTTALRNAIAFLNKNGGGKLYVPDPPKFYAFAGDGIFVGDNIEIFGDGKGKSEIRNISPTSGRFLNGPIFLFSTYGPNNKSSIFQNGVEAYSIQDAKQGDSIVNLQDINDAQNLYDGEIVVLGGHKHLRNDIENQTRFHFMELNEINSIKNGKVYFKYPFTIPLTKDNKGGASVIVNINNTSSKNVQLNRKNGTSKNIYIHDLSLTQAQTDELNGVPISKNLQNGLSGVWQPGGAFNSRFENLKIEAYSGLGGNMFTRCAFRNIDLYSTKKLIDFGYGGSNDTLHDIRWMFSESPASDFASSFIICNDGTHNILIYNIKASGDWNGESLILLSQAKNIDIHNTVFNFPNYAKANALIQIGDNGENLSRDINLDSMQIVVNTAGAFLRIGGSKDIAESNRNINISNLSFKGNVSEKSQELMASSMATNQRKASNKVSKISNKNAKNVQSIFVKNINGLTLNNISVPSGELYFENCNNSKIEKIIAPSSTLNVKGSRSNTKFNQLTVIN